MGAVSVRRILSWQKSGLAILLENRSFEIGNPVAKDAKAFLNGGIPLLALAEAMKLGKLGEQICIRSKVAFSRLQYIDATLAGGQEYYIKRTARDKKAREE